MMLHPYPLASSAMCCTFGSVSFYILKAFCVCIDWCSEADEIYKICSVIGSPAELEWAEGIELANTINYQFPQVSWS